MSHTKNSDQRALDRRLETMAWGLAFLAFGAFEIIPGNQEDAFLASVGAILLGLNMTRAATGLETSWFTIVLGATALVAGAGSMFLGTVPFLGLVFVVIGASLVIRAGGAVAASTARERA